MYILYTIIVNIFLTGLFPLQALKKKLAGKRDDWRWCQRHEQVYAVAGATSVDELLQRYDYYDNEAVDNMINEFIDNKQKATTAHRHQTSWAKLHNNIVIVKAIHSNIQEPI